MATNPIRLAEEQYKRHRHPLDPTGRSWQVRDIESQMRVYLPDALFKWYSTRAIADRVGVAQATVSKWLILLGFNQREILERAARHLQEDPSWR